MIQIARALVGHLVAIAACGLTMTHCCTCQGGGESPTYSIGMAERGHGLGGDAAWGRLVPVREVVVRVRFYQDGVTPAREMIEVLDVDGARVGPPGRMVRGVSEPYSCGSWDLFEYDLTSLAPGTYTMVHRLSTAPSGLTITDDAERSTFEGEAALQLTLFVEERADGGSRDAAPGP